MKIITLNLARKDDLGEDYAARIKRIADFLDQEQADVVCFQEVSFSENGQSLADDINKLMKKPYKNVLSKLSRKCKIKNVPPEKRATSMKKLYKKDKNAIFTDGEAAMSNLDATELKTLRLHKVATDERGRRDPHPRIAQNLNFKNFKITNIHLAANNNAHIQLEELLKRIKHDRTIIGDFNMTSAQLKQHQDLWQKDYCLLAGTYPYVSFPADAVAYDHALIPKNYRTKLLGTKNNLSDHNALIFEITNQS